MLFVAVETGRRQSILEEQLQEVGLVGGGGGRPPSIPPDHIPVCSLSDGPDMGIAGPPLIQHWANALYQPELIPENTIHYPMLF